LSSDDVIGVEGFHRHGRRSARKSAAQVSESENYIADRAIVLL
jgi:hypothetical protein